MKFGQVLYILMKQKDISQQKLAENIGVTQRAVSKWINLQSEPTESAIVNCAKFFDVTSDYILGIEDEAGRKAYDVGNQNNIQNNYGGINTFSGNINIDNLKK